MVLVVVIALETVVSHVSSARSEIRALDARVHPLGAALQTVRSEARAATIEAAGVAAQSSADVGALRKDLNLARASLGYLDAQASAEASLACVVES